jgi:hypothetical protein
MRTLSGAGSCNASSTRSVPALAFFSPPLFIRAPTEKSKLIQNCDLFVFFWAFIGGAGMVSVGGGVSKDAFRHVITALI